MDPFEYVIVLTSLILGLGITQVLVGVADVITNKNIKWSLPHGLMTLLIFFTMIQEWWETYKYSFLVKEWTLILVMVLMIYPIILFVGARVLFPYEKIEIEDVDLEQYYWKKWPVLFTVGLLTAIISIWQNYLYEHISLYNQIFPQITLAVIYCVFLFRNITNRVVHITFLSLELVAWIVYVIQEDFTI